MRLTHLASDRIVIARFVTISGDKMAFATVTVEMAHVQPTGNSSTEIAEGVFGKQFRLYFDGGVNLQEGDRLRNSSTGAEYTVVADGANRRTYGSIDYVIALVQKTK